MNLVNDLVMALDPAAMMYQAGLPPDPWQAEALGSEAGRILMLCCRQSGKSTTTAALALHQAIYHPDSLILLLSPSLRQSSELFKKVMGFYRYFSHLAPARNESVLRIELENDSRIVSLPGKEGTVRGYSGVSLLIIDEAARVGDSLYYSVRPMLAVSGGRLVALSTPWGKRGWFFNEYTGAADWERYKITARDCPRISPEFLAEERAAMPDWIFRSEYLCEFTESEDSVFSYDEVMSAISDDVTPLFEVA